LAYSVAGAATAVGVGITVIRQALRDGSLKKRYLGTKPIVLTEDLNEWLHGLPTMPTPKPLPIRP
jgi:hypothetical protein